MKNDHAFTLIELLVVIAIIAVLMSILMPVLHRVREQARMISCASNQKQLILGLVGYATENDDNLPPSPVKLAAISAKKANYHHPMELNMHYSNAWGPVSNVQDRNYAFAGKYLSGYLPDVEVFNCKVAPIRPEDRWPPPGSSHEPVSTYGELYKTGVWAPLHSTYMLLWNYQGWNDEIGLGTWTRNVIGVPGEEYSRYVGPTKASSSKVKLVVQDAIQWRTNAGVLFPGSESNVWYSSHNMKNSIRGAGTPFYMQTERSRVIPDVLLNAGYLDGHVSRYRAGEGLRVGAAAHESVIPSELR